MKDRKKRFHFLAGAAVISAYLMTSHLTTAYAGDINANEQAIVNEVSGVFVYEGKQYRAYDDYIALAKQYLAMDEYDLTKEQCDQVIAKVRANVARGIAEGYLYEVTEEKTEDKTEDKTENTEDNTKADSQNGGTAAKPEESDTGSKEQEGQESTTNISKEENETGKVTETPDGKEDETADGSKEYAETISDMLSGAKEESNKEIVIKNTGFSVKRTAITGAALTGMLVATLAMAGSLGCREKKNEQNS